MVKLPSSLVPDFPGFSAFGTSALSAPFFYIFILDDKWAY